MTEPSKWALERARQFFDRLSDEALKNGNPAYWIPFSKEELALALDAAQREAIEEVAQCLLRRASAFDSFERRGAIYNGFLMAEELRADVKFIRALADKEPSNA